MSQPAARATAAGLAVTFSVYRREVREYLRQLVPAARIKTGGLGNTHGRDMAMDQYL
jgi:hypothetical protein